ncbi:hypothetical protein DPMN_088508 [Dreissena polymorpha]|uniref:Uncharacterized protein n=1 Tax=Dreissena polymorpha TaxID=45954 RepID=A0A9D4QWK3_DREPO|nr:hypothetical protein DPMN_088508 [Dreissena polymorpha]
MEELVVLKSCKRMMAKWRKAARRCTAKMVEWAFLTEWNWGKNGGADFGFGAHLEVTRSALAINCAPIGYVILISNAAEISGAISNRYGVGNIFTATDNSKCSLVMKAMAR